VHEGHCRRNSASRFGGATARDGIGHCKHGNFALYSRWTASTFVADNGPETIRECYHDLRGHVENTCAWNLAAATSSTWTFKGHRGPLPFTTPNLACCERKLNVLPVNICRTKLRYRRHLLCLFIFDHASH
jgi:hypothetical protein